MATAAIGTNLDAHWRVFQAEDKPLTPRGRSRLRGNRRTRGHEVLKKHNGSPKRSGRRTAALARTTAGDLASGLIDFLESLSEQATTLFWATPEVDAYSECTEDALKTRLAEEQQVIDERHHIILGAIEYEYCSRLHELPEIRAKCDSYSRAIAELETERSEVSSFELYEIDKQIVELTLKRDLLHCEVELLGTYQPAA